jgi:hypothetical protein
VSLHQHTDRSGAPEIISGLDAPLRLTAVICSYRPQNLDRRSDASSTTDGANVPDPVGPSGFWSYVHRDDEQDDERITSSP